MTPGARPRTEADQQLGLQPQQPGDRGLTAAEQAGDLVGGTGGQLRHQQRWMRHQGGGEHPGTVAVPRGPRRHAGLVTGAVPLASAMIVLLAGCGDGGPESVTPATPTPTSAAPSASPSPSTPRNPVGLRPRTITGTVERGVESGCVLLRGFLLLGGDRELLQPGRQVTVTGRAAPNAMTTCQQGIPFSVSSARPR